MSTLIMSGKDFNFNMITTPPPHRVPPNIISVLSNDFVALARRTCYIARERFREAAKLVKSSLNRFLLLKKKQFDHKVSTKPLMCELVCSSCSSSPVT